MFFYCNWFLLLQIMEFHETETFQNKKFKGKPKISFFYIYMVRQT